MDAKTWIAVTHWWPHIDELLGIWLTLSERFRAAAEHKFPGITGNGATIVIEYWRRGNEVPEWATSRDKVRRMRRIPVGIWRDVSIYDEHAGLNSPGAPGECAADLVAGQLRLDGDSRLVPLLAAVRENDTKGMGGRFGLGALVKALHEARPNEGTFVAQLAFDAFDAAVAAEEAKIAGKPAASLDLDSIGQRIAGTDGELAQIWREAVAEEVAKPRYLSLVAVTRAIAAHKSEAVALDWALHVLRALAAGKEIFASALQDVKASGRVWGRMISGRETKIALAKSDSPAALRAMKRLVNEQPEVAQRIAVAKQRDGRYTAPAILVVRRSTGNTVVEAQGGATLVQVAVALRAAEAKKRGWGSGDPRVFVVWHYMKELECCFNGSNTSPDVMPTTLSGDEIAKLVTDTLCPVPIRAGR